MGCVVLYFLLPAAHPLHARWHVRPSQCSNSHPLAVSLSFSAERHQAVLVLPFVSGPGSRLHCSRDPALVCVWSSIFATLLLRSLAGFISALCSELFITDVFLPLNSEDSSHASVMANVHWFVLSLFFFNVSLPSSRTGTSHVLYSVWVFPEMLFKFQVFSSLMIVPLPFDCWLSV